MTTLTLDAGSRMRREHIMCDRREKINASAADLALKAPLLAGQYPARWRFILVGLEEMDDFE